MKKKRNKDVYFTVIQMLIQTLFDQKLLLGTAICWAIIWVPKDEKGSCTRPYARVRLAVCGCGLRVRLAAAGNSVSMCAATT